MINLFLITPSFLLPTSFTYALSKKSIFSLDQTTIPLVTVKGDFNGDGILDSMWLSPYKIVPNKNDCLSKFTRYINFSDPTIPPIKVENCIGGIPTNLGDLNKNGTFV